MTTPNPTEKTTTDTGTKATRAAGPRSTRRWRTVDIVVAAVIGVAFGLLFAAWNNFIYPLFGAFRETPFSPLVAGVWLLPAVVGALIVRKPGAALFTELLAATVSLFFGSVWGLTVFMSGLWQGLGAELLLALLAYRRWGFGAALLAGSGAGLAMGINETIVYVATYSMGNKAIYIGSSVVTGIVIAGALGWLLVRGLARTGALAQFPSGRAQTEI